mgnify:CR=1 FL=1
MKKEKLPATLAAIQGNPKAMKLYNRAIAKINAMQGIHKIEHLDGMGNNKKTQWPFGLARRLPLQESHNRSMVHTTLMSLAQLNMLKDTKSEISKLTNIDDFTKSEIINTAKLALDYIDKAKKKPITEYELLKCLKSKGTSMCIYSSPSRRTHTSKYVKNLCKKHGRKKAKKIMRQHEQVL